MLFSSFFIFIFLVKKFVRLQQILTEEKLALVENVRKKKYVPLCFKAVIIKFNTAFSTLMLPYRL
jgi:hypothetical protein